jgi:hypothetical protein
MRMKMPEEVSATLSRRLRPRAHISILRYGLSHSVLLHGNTKALGIPRRGRNYHFVQFPGFGGFCSEPQSLCSTLFGSVGPSMHGMELRYS